ncbi:MAG: hypothetical protein FH761_08520 [Firmicutes bacterium]|nr:hypothetical protein [Bacillota bacterium]
MEIFNATEILDKLAEKSNMFKMINDDFKAKDEKIAQLTNELNSTKEMVDFLLLNNPPTI